MLDGGTTLADRCTGRWRSILGALGMPAKFLTGKNGPCPMCGGRDRFRWTNRKGSGDFWCNTCSPQHGSGTQLVMAYLGVDFKRAAQAIEGVIGEARMEKVAKVDPAKQRKLMGDLWAVARDLQEHGPDGKYLVSRGLKFAPWSCLRFYHMTPYDAGRREPAILALVRNERGDAVNIHRIFITEDGRKTELKPARKLMWGPAPPGSAIRLFPLAETLGVAEGVETALAAAQLFEMPVWSVICAEGLARFMPPEGVKHVVIFADNDRSYTGQAAAYGLARKLVVEHRLAAHVELSPDAGRDWNDELLLVERAGAGGFGAAAVSKTLQAPARV